MKLKEIEADKMKVGKKYLARYGLTGDIYTVYLIYDFDKLILRCISSFGEEEDHEIHNFIEFWEIPE